MVEVAREFFVSGGTLPLDSESYIERSADRDLLNHLVAGRYCYVLNSRQMGKSSLSVRTIAKLNERGIKTAFIDLTQIGQNVQAEQWYAGLTGEVGRAFGLTSQVLKYFKSKSDVSPMLRFFGAIREIVLEEVKEPIVIFIDEIDSTRSLTFDTDEFYAGIRECFNRRVVEERCQRLTFCLIGVAVPNDLIRNPLMTPFNIGEKIRLQDFELEEAQRFGAVLGPNGNRLARRVHYWTNGQPFLTQNLCREIAADTRIQEERDVDSLVQRLYFGPKALESNVNLADVANRVLWLPEELIDPDKYRASLMSAYERTWKGGSIPDDEANRIAVVLKLSGLLRTEGARLFTRNRIYHHVFNRAWIQTNMPNQELLRQLHSFRRGLARGISFAALIGGVIGGLALFAFRARHEAIDAKSALEYQLYVSQMNSLSLLEGSGDQAGMAAVLESSRKNPNRGFEWNFWMGRLHDGIEEYTLDYSAPGKNETGFLSQDGSQICVEDLMSKTGVIVDRKTQRVVATADIPFRGIIASKIGFLVIRSFGVNFLGDQADTSPDNPKPVIDVATGKIVCNIGTPGYLLIGEVTRRNQSNCVVMEEQKKGDVQDRLFSAWDITTGQCLYRVQRPRETVYPRDPDSLRAPVSKDAHRFCFRLLPPSKPGTKGLNDFLIIWDAAANREQDRLPKLGNGKLIAMSESGKFLAYLDDQKLKVRDLDQRREIYSLETGIDPPISVSISPDDRTLACVNSNGIATIREIPSGRILAVRSNLRSIEATHDGSLWVGCSSSVRILNISLTDGRHSSRTTVAADGQGDLRVVTRGSPLVKRLSDPRLSPLPSLPLPSGAKSLTYNRLWCLTPGPNDTNYLTSIGGNSPPVHIPMAAGNMACGIHSDIFTVSGYNDRKWHGMSGATGAILWTTSKAGEYGGMWLTRDSSHLIASTDSGYIVSLDPKTGRELKRVKASRHFISSLSFSRDGRQIVTGGGEGLAVLWDTDTLTKLREFRGNTAQAIWAADISPDGSRIATCTDVGEWQIWNSKTSVKLTKIRDSNLALRSVTFTADGKNLLTAGDDGTMRIWPGLDHDPTMKIKVPSENLKYISLE